MDAYNSLQKDNHSPGSPSQLQIAFALAILKSKPADVSIRDYIHNLRKNLGIGPIYPQQSRQWVIDQIAFWRSEYEKVKTTETQMSEEIIDLKHEIEMLRAAQSITEIAPTSGLKRKDLLRTAKRPAKKVKAALDTSSVISGALIGEVSILRDEAEAFQGFGEDGASLVRSLFMVHQFCKSEEPDGRSFSNHLCQVANSIGSIFSKLPGGLLSAGTTVGSVNNTTLPAPVLARRQAASDLSNMLRAVARAFSTLLHGLSKFPATGHEDVLTADVIYSCVGMFKSAIRAITEISNARATSEASNAPRSADSHAPASSRTRAKDKKPTPTQDSGRAIAQFLHACITSLNPKKARNKELFEGLLYVVLERLGQRLFLSTFGHDRQRTVAEDIALSRKIEPMCPMTARSLAIEVPYLLSVLEKALGVAPQMLGVALPTTARSKPTYKGKQSSDAKAQTSAPKSLLSSDAKDRLQRTLVNAMFGADGDGELRRCLKMPLPRPRIPSPPKEEEGDVGTWFQKEMWRLVGWDILGREGHW